MKRSILFLVLVLLGAFLSAQEPPAPAAPAAPAGPPPEAVVPQDAFDAGNVLRGKKLEHEFTIKNTGKGELTILSARPG